jgi:hypothetical protein
MLSTPNVSAKAAEAARFIKETLGPIPPVPVLDRLAESVYMVL